jgi:hypothetical protein
MKLLEKIGFFAMFAFLGCVVLATWMCIAAIIGVFVTDPFLSASFHRPKIAGSQPYSVVAAIGQMQKTIKAIEVRKK